MEKGMNIKFPWDKDVKSVGIDIRLDQGDDDKGKESEVIDALLCESDMSCDKDLW